MKQPQRSSLTSSDRTNEACAVEAEVRRDGDGVTPLAGPDVSVEVRSKQRVPQHHERCHRRLAAAPPQRPDVNTRPLLDGRKQIALMRPERERE